ncbi:MAG: NADH-quinone oxidoreductase subunit A [Dehalococcoidia bacterium]
MAEGFADNWTIIAIAGGVAVLFIGILFLASYLLAPRRQIGRGRIPYECGIEASPFSWSRTNIRYYVFGLAFLIFDVEVVFLFPWSVIFLEATAAVFYEMVIFLGILMFGLTYAWRKGALKWK